MDKRNLVKGITVGTLAGIWAAGTGGRSVFASEPDWRDEALGEHDVSFQLHRYSVCDGNINTYQILRVYTWDGKFKVQHTNILYSEHSWQPIETIADETTEHSSLEEAYKYAKELKTKYYS
jgi:hypothetical protein